MKRYTLTLVDTVGIQDYIFGTNQLAQNVGASYLVDCAVRKWAVESLEGSHNVLNLDDPDRAFADTTIEENNLDAEVVYAGGGHTEIIFASREKAVEFARRLTSRILTEAPGLRVAVTHEDFDWEQDALGGPRGVVDRLWKQLARKKAEQRLSSPLLGLGVTAACVFNGLPATGEDRDNEGRPISAEVQAKLKAERAAHKRLRKLVGWPEYEVPKDFDDFGRTKGESSYVAVVHTDGNGMGKRIRRLREQFGSPSDNRQYVRQMREFSLSVQRAAYQALQSTVSTLARAVRVENGKAYIGSTKEIMLRNNILPFRPIVFGGDDVTFVCDGRLGLELAACYLRRFTDNKLADGAPAHCRAGIALVRTHFPFARAYALAEDLCRSAKEYIEERRRPPYSEHDLTVMDWHFVTGGQVRSLNEIRRREYRGDEGPLFMRPVRLTDQHKDWRSWDTFASLVREFRTGDHWAGRRNKIMALRRALRAGPDAVEHFRSVYDLPSLPQISGQPEMATRGWQGGRCGYFDAIEAMDFFVFLEGEE